MTSAFFVCKEGDHLKTLKKLSKCVKWSRSIGNRDRNIRRCLEKVRYFGIASIEGTRERCTKWKMTRSHGTTKEFVLPMKNIIILFHYLMKLQFIRETLVDVMIEMVENFSLRHYLLKIVINK